MTDILLLLVALAGAYIIGSIPFAYLIVRAVTGRDITGMGSGNVGAMNVRRSTGSWGWFTVAMLSDALKGFLPVLLVKAVVTYARLGDALPLRPWEISLTELGVAWWSLGVLVVPLVFAGLVLGHNYSLWMALIEHRFSQTGKGLATGGGALLAYDWRYCLAALIVGLTVIALTRYMMAGQVAAAATLPVTAALLHASDWSFAFLMGGIVYAAHHRRFVGLLRGREPRLYIEDRMGPRG